jgi:hypothetical protein
VVVAKMFPKLINLVAISLLTNADLGQNWLLNPVTSSQSDGYFG